MPPPDEPPRDGAENDRDGAENERADAPSERCCDCMRGLDEKPERDDVYPRAEAPRDCGNEARDVDENPSPECAADVPKDDAPDDREARGDRGVFVLRAP